VRCTASNQGSLGAASEPRPTPRSSRGATASHAARAAPRSSCAARAARLAGSARLSSNVSSARQAVQCLSKLSACRRELNSHDGGEAAKQPATCSSKPTGEANYSRAATEPTQGRRRGIERKTWSHGATSSRQTSLESLPLQSARGAPPPALHLYAGRLRRRHKHVARHARRSGRDWHTRLEFQPKAGAHRRRCLTSVEARPNGIAPGPRSAKAYHAPRAWRNALVPLTSNVSRQTDPASRAQARENKDHDFATTVASSERDHEPSRIEREARRTDEEAHG